MNENPSHLEADASRKVLWPILGLMGGLLVGSLWSWLAGADVLKAISLVIAGGMVGSALGMSMVLAHLFPLRLYNPRSLRGLGFLALAAGVIFWFVLGQLSVLLTR